MSIISDYIFQVKNAIEKLPCVLADELIIDNRGDVVLYLKGTIVFTNQSEFHLKEYSISVPEFKKIAYSYHYQAADRRLIFKIFSTGEASLSEVLELINDLVK
jgi:hypothetical protein